MKSKTSLGTTLKTYIPKMLENLKEKKMGEFPNAYDLPKLKPAEINNLKRLILSHGIEFIIKISL